MIANDLITKASTLCRQLRRPFPVELKAYATGWQREGFELTWCWFQVKQALLECRAISLVEAPVRKHFADLQAVRDAKQREMGRPLALCSPIPRAGDWDIGPGEQTLPAPAPATNGADPFRRWPWVRPLEVLQEVRSTSPESESRRGGRKDHEGQADRVRDFIQRQIVRKGQVPVATLEYLAEAQGLLRPGQKISDSSAFRRAKKDLDIQARKIGLGRGGYWVWRLRPPAWTSQTVSDAI